MGILTSTLPTLIDKFSREDGSKKVMKIVELMAKQNDILQDAEYQECNDGSKHKTTMRSGIPEPTWRMFNQGIQPSKSTTVPVLDTTGMMEDYGLVDKALADLSGNADAFRASENMAKLQGFNNKAARYMIYGNTQSEPQAFLGLAPRYNDKSAESGANIVDTGGTGSTNTSIWFVTWGKWLLTCCTRKAPLLASSTSSSASKPHGLTTVAILRPTAITSSGILACRYVTGALTLASRTST